MPECESDSRSAGRTDDSVHEASLLFVGQILTHLSHELNNHIATLHESIGLAEDILQAKHPSDKAAYKEISDMVRGLDQRVRLLVPLIRHMSSFGSRLGHRSMAFDVNSIAEELISLLGKRATQRKLTVLTVFDRGIPLITNDPFLVQLLLWGLFDTLFSRLEQGCTITLKTSRSRSSVMVSLASDKRPVSPPEQGTASEKVLNDVANRIGAIVHVSEGDGGFSIELPIL